ncbi:MAG: hypothetical protein ACRD19_02320, partial [Terriglobia bacterium]
MRGEAQGENGSEKKVSFNEYAYPSGLRDADGRSGGLFVDAHDVLHGMGARRRYGCTAAGSELRHRRYRVTDQVRLQRQGLHKFSTHQTAAAMAAKADRASRSNHSHHRALTKSQMKEYMKNVALIPLAFTIALAMGVTAARAQDGNGAGAMLRLYVDPTTKIVYTSPGPHRHLLVAIPVSALNAGALQKKTESQLHDNQQRISTLAQQNQELESSNHELTREMAEIKPAWRSYIDNFQNKFRIGTLVYGDYRFYTHTGFQPQELTQITNPGPGNNLYNSFDLTRTYLNFYFFPTKDWTLRVTPNLYKTIGPSNDKIGSTTGFASNLDGNVGVRIKYANLHYNSLWDDVPMLKGGTVSIGQQANPLVGWEEDLYGFRYVNLTPWNYLGLSSTQLGIAMQGPVHLFGSEKTYLEYGFGVYNNASFHAFEETNTKEVMARITAYPFGATWRFQGLGLSGFYNYGYGNTTPDAAEIPTALKGGNAHITRIAALLHYTAEQWGLAGEFDYGNNAFSASNLFSGSGPADAFGFATGSAVTKPVPWNSTCSASKPCYS